MATLQSNIVNLKFRNLMTASLIYVVGLLAVNSSTLYLYFQKL